jgi:hypothetical protein
LNFDIAECRPAIQLRASGHSVRRGKTGRPPAAGTLPAHRRHLDEYAPDVRVFDPLPWFQRRSVRGDQGRAGLFTPTRTICSRRLLLFSDKFTF